MGHPVRPAGFIDRATATVIRLASATLQPAYRPSVLFPAGVAASLRLQDELEAGTQAGYATMAKLLRKSAGGSRKDSLSAKEAAENVLRISGQLRETAARSDPDGLAADLVRLLCMGVPQMDNLDNRRRVVATWSAILAPSVVMREKTKRPITTESIAQCGIDWVARGFTADAQDAWGARDTRFIAKHPARMYELISDSSQAHELDHEKLMLSMIKPVLVSIGQYIGAARAASGEVLVRRGVS
jgi:hypothetical protein